MAREDNNSPFNVVASDNKITAYDTNSAVECCDAANFLVDISGSPKSPWNRSCGRVFGESFCEEYPEHKGYNVEKAWVTHLESLQKAYRKTLNTAEENEHINSIKHRRERKNQV